MAWITLTESKVEARLTKPELAALLTAARQDDQTDAGLLAAAISAVTAEVRGYVAACAKNTLGESGTIPEELESAALALIRRHLFTRLPALRNLYDAIREQETKDALERLRDTAACKFAIVPPVTAAPEQAAGPGVQVISSRTRIATREGLSGL
jgi:hypothetical protein